MSPPIYQASDMFMPLIRQTSDVHMPQKLTFMKSVYQLHYTRGEHVFSFYNHTTGLPKRTSRVVKNIFFKFVCLSQIYKKKDFSKKAK